MEFITSDVKVQYPTTQRYKAWDVFAVWSGLPGSNCNNFTNWTETETFFTRRYTELNKMDFNGLDFNYTKKQVPINGWSSGRRKLWGFQSQISRRELCWRRVGWGEPGSCRWRWRRIPSSWFSRLELLEGLAPAADTRFLNHVAWNLGLPPPLFEFEFEFPATGEFRELFEVTLARNWYATLLADTISVLACLNYYYYWPIREKTK